MTPTEARRAIRATGIRHSMIAKKLGVTDSFLSFRRRGRRASAPGFLNEAVCLARALAKAIDGVSRSSILVQRDFPASSKP